MRRFGYLGLSFGVAAMVGCARGPDLAVNGLALQRVVIYRNGVGYFERRGKIDAEEVSFRVRKERVGDFLATLAVIEAEGSSVHSASFPVGVDKEAEEEETDEDKSSDAPAKKKKPDDKDDLETVKLTLDGRQHDLTVGYVAETPVWRPSYRLVVHGKDATHATPSADLQAWGIVQNLSGEDWNGVHLSLVAGAPLAFQSTLEKAVVPERPVVTDTGEVISSVPTSETSLSEQPPAPPPPPPAIAAAAPPPSDAPSLDSLANSKADRDSDGVPDATDKDAKKKGAAHKAPARKVRVGGLKPSDAAGRGAGPMGAPAAPAAEAVAGLRQANPSPPRNLRSLAAVAMEAGTTHYDLPFTVDVPNHSATMVLLVAKPVPGESIFLFAPDGGVPGSTAHPFRVARFTNDTLGLLERGPIAVFENGAFLGQGMVDPLPPGATATVPFALERSLGVESARTDNEEGARLAKIEGGRIEIERDWVTHTKYTVKNGAELVAKLLVKHGRQYGTRLFGPPKGTEDNTGTQTALVPVDVPPHASAVLDVDERKENRREVDPLDPLADDAARGYMKDSRSDQAVVALLRPAWEARDKLRSSVDEKQKLEAEKYQLDGQIGQIDRSLKAIEKNRLADQLRKDLTDRLGKAHARLDEVTKRLIVVEMQVSEQAIRFRDLLLAIKMLKPLPPPSGAL